MKIIIKHNQTKIVMGQFTMDIWQWKDSKNDSIDLEIDVKGYGGYSASYGLMDEEIDQFIDALVAFRARRNPPQTRQE
jgi:hypothetical protein